MQDSKARLNKSGLLARSKFPLLRRLSTVCLAVMCITAIALISLYWQDQLNEHKDIAAQENEKALDFIEHLLSDQIKVVVAKSNASDIQPLLTAPNIDSVMASALVDIRPVEALKVKIYNLSGVTIYSTVREDIGRTSSHPDFLAKALRGKTSHQAEFRKAFSSPSGVLHDIHIALTYRQLMYAGKTIGAIEIYRDITPLYQRRLAKTMQIAFIVFVAFALLYAVLIFIVFRMDRAVAAWQRMFVESRKRFHTLFDFSNDGLFILDMQGNFIDINKTAYERLGYAKDEMLAMKITELDPPEFAAKAPERINQIINDEISVFETAHYRKDGSIMPVEVNARLIELDGEKVVFSVVRDITERKQAEERLRLTQFVSDHASDGIFWIDEQARICYVNEAAAREHGYAKEELLGLSLLDLKLGFYADAWLATWQELKQKGHIIFETMHRRKDGSVFPVEVAANFVSFGDKEYSVAFARDITERKQAEEAIQEYTQKLQKIQRLHEEAQRIAHLGHWELDLVNHKLTWSDEECRIFGVEPGEVDTYETFLKTVHPDDRAYVDHDYTESVKNRTLHDIEHRLLMPDGSIKWVHERCVTTYSDEDGTPLHSIGTTLDITEHKLTEGKASMLFQAVENVAESMMLTDKDAIIEYVNPAFTEITGYLPEEVIGKAPAVLRSSAQNSSFYKELWDTITGGEIWHGTLIDKKKDGSFYPALMSIAPIRGANKEITHFIALQQDMTEYKKMEEQFLQAQKMEAIGTLVGGIAHDFNNMLAAIQGNVYLAKRKLKNQPEIDVKLDSIEQLGTRAANMVKQLLTFARKDQMKLHALSLNPFIRETHALVRATLPENIVFSCELSQEELTVKGDATQLQQVLMNLLNNARDAVFYVSQPKISCNLKLFVPTADFVKAHPDMKGKRFAQLTVADNGRGIDAGHLEKVFEPFFTTKGVGEGTGLGLAMVYGAVHSHGGIIEVESEKGVGTAFYVYLPLTEEVEDSVQKDAGGITRGRGETILLVDDEQEMRITSAEVFKDLGYQVLVAGDGEEALQIFRAHQHDIRLVISDVVMPNMGGVDLAKAIRRLDKKVPIIFATGYAKDQAMSAEDQVEQSIIISKPFSYIKLSHTMRRLITSQ